METREIKLILTNSTEQKTIKSKATKLGELLDELQSSGVNCDDMIFYEGRSRLALKDAESLLPDKVPVKDKNTGEITYTRDLVFMVTTAKSKIKSGAYTRKEILELVREQGLWNEVIEHFGRNATQCKSADLLAFVEFHGSEDNSKPSEEESTKDESTDLSEEEVDKMFNWI